MEGGYSEWLRAELRCCWLQRDLRVWRLFGEVARGVCARVCVPACVRELLAFTSSYHHFPSASLSVYFEFFLTLPSRLMIFHHFLSFPSPVRTSHPYISSHHAASLASVLDPLPDSPTPDSLSLSFYRQTLPDPTSTSPPPSLRLCRANAGFSSAGRRRLTSGRR